MQYLAYASQPGLQQLPGVWLPLVTNILYNCILHTAHIDLEEPSYIVPAKNEAYGSLPVQQEIIEDNPAYGVTGQRNAQNC